MAKNCMRCYHCSLEFAKNTFTYYDNGKQTQPRYQCSNCHKFFTLGSQGYPQGRSYAKKRNVDPPELKGLPRECCSCGVPNNAPFKYYNNKNLLQSRFKCLSCGQQFQMRLMGTGKKRHLVHTSSYQRPLINQKLSLAPNSTIASNLDNEMSTDPRLLVLEEGQDFPFLSVEDTRYLDLIEAGLNDENEAPPPSVVLRLQLWASKLPRCCC